MRNKEPIDLILAKGKTHISKKNIEKRKREELKISACKVDAPTYLSEKQKEKFDDIASKLLDYGIITELDVDCLVRYVLSYELYLEYSKKINELLNEYNDRDIRVLKEIQIMQDKAFRQAQTSARDMGLTITTRCRIVMPQIQENEEDEEL